MLPNALCVIFTIFVSFLQDNALFASKAKINFFEILSSRGCPKGTRSEVKISKTLILVFEVIVQPPKTHFLTFSSETKIMKITHSANGIIPWDEHGSWKINYFLSPISFTNKSLMCIQSLSNENIQTHWTRFEVWVQSFFFEVQCCIHIQQFGFG